MKIARLAGLMLVAVMALGLVVTSVAAAAPEFNPSSGVKILGTSGIGKLVANNGTETVTCEKDTSSGEVTSATLAGNILVHFLGCHAVSSTGECTVKSEGAPAENLIITTTLHGLLGLVLGGGTSSASDVGLLLLPGSGKRFVTLEGTCLATDPIQVTGLVAGLIEPVGKSAKTAKLVLATSSGKQAITDIDVSGGSLVAPKLTAGTTAATEETTELLNFDGAELEVT